MNGPNRELSWSVLYIRVTGNDTGEDLFSVIGGAFTIIFAVPINDDRALRHGRLG